MSEEKKGLPNDIGKIVTRGIWPVDNTYTCPYCGQTFTLSGNSGYKCNCRFKKQTNEN